MAKYTVSVTFWGTIEAKDAEEAFEKVMDDADCEAFEDSLEKCGLTDIKHEHEEPEGW